MIEFTSRFVCPLRNSTTIAFLLAMSWSLCACAQDYNTHNGDLDALPQVPAGFQVEFAAREPLVRNPCSMAFDHHGRLFIGMGPQYRSPQPDTPGDRVVRLEDRDGDGEFDHAHPFASGFNCIQSLVWNGTDLWVANAPDLTLVRDTDGDDVADEYIKVYTDLGNLEHGLHGLNVGPDGRLYMSKGNSKGHSRPTSEQPHQIAPRPFRDLWGAVTPPGTPDSPPPQRFTAATYRRSYHDPADDWGREGGVLVCDADGQNLEIMSRGFRNPWDIAFDAGFHWLGTDNDQDQGDRVFSPFFGAHYGWGHPWSADWTGREHLPTAPISGPVFHGSGTGIVYCDSDQFPPAYRGVWFFNDWLRRTTFVFRPRWDGAALQPAGDQWQEFVTGGEALFKPTDLEVGPDGALYILGWGREYGVQWDENGNQVNAGRIFRVSWNQARQQPAARSSKPYVERSFSELINEFDSPLPARRVRAQQELIRRDAEVREQLWRALDSDELSVAAETWIAWTLGRMAWRDETIDRAFVKFFERPSRLNLRIQALRILAARVRLGASPVSVLAVAGRGLLDPEPRIRMAAVQAVRRTGLRQTASKLQNLCAKETDRVVFYAAWQALRVLLSRPERREWLTHPAAGVRRAALLALAEDRSLIDSEVEALLADADPINRQLAALWVAKKSGNSLLVVHPQPGEFDESVEVRITPGLKPAAVYYTTDGSVPTSKSKRWNGAIAISETTTIRAALYSGNRQVGPIADFRYRRRSTAEVAARSGFFSVAAESGRAYPIVPGGLRTGANVYTDRKYTFKQIPSSLEGSTLIQTPNQDAGSRGAQFLEFETVVPITVYVAHDTRVSRKPDWLLQNGSRGFEKTDLRLTTSDAVFELFRQDFAPGRIVLGGNTTDGTDSGKSNYIVLLRSKSFQFTRPLLHPTTIAGASELMQKANIERGRALFFASAAGCAKCHRADGEPGGFGPDLAHLVQKKDPLHVIRSILQPSVQITEGYAMQSVLLEDGRVVSGLLRSETAQVLTLAQSDGTSVAVPAEQIELRSSQPISPMPAYDEVLKPQDVADLTAWLLAEHSSVEAAGPPEKRQRVQRKPIPYDHTSARFSVFQERGALVFRLNRRLLGRYVYEHEKLTRPAWIDMHSTSGIRVTRNFPPRLPEDEGAMDHELMHPGIWISFGHLDGEDYWRLTSRTRHAEFVESPSVEQGVVSFAVRNEYLRRDKQQVVCQEVTRYRLVPRPEGILMLIDAEFRSETADFYFGDQEESGLAFRVESKLRVDAGRGTILNDRGERNGKGIWGKPAKWVDYAAPVDGRHVGLMVMPSPHNARPCWMHVRDYGLVVANPFPRQPKERREPYVRTVVRRGEPYRLSYALLIHDRAAGEPFDQEQVYRESIQRLEPHANEP